MLTHDQVNASLITRITSWLKFLGKYLHLVGCATVWGKSEVMLIHIRNPEEAAAVLFCQIGRQVYRQTSVIGLDLLANDFASVVLMIVLNNRCQVKLS